MDPYRSRQRFNAEEEVYIERVVNYSLAFEKSSAQLRETRTREQIKVVHNRARAEWEDEENGFPSRYIPEVGSSASRAMWDKLNTIITSNATSDRELCLKCIAGFFAMSALIENDLAEHLLQIEIMNEAGRRTLLRMPREDEMPVNGPSATVEKPLPTYLELVERDIPGLDLIIIDCGTSLSKGPWVEYLPRNGTKEKDEVIVPADVMEDMLEERKDLFRSFKISARL